MTLIEDPDPSKGGSECLLYGLYMAHRLFCNPLSKIGGVIALTLPGFPILIGALETAGGHHSSGLSRIYSMMINLVGLSCAILLGSYFGGLIIWVKTDELRRKPSHHPDYMDLIPQLNGTYGQKMHLRPNDKEPQSPRPFGWAFKTPPGTYWFKFAYAMGFLVFSIPTFNGAVLCRRTIIHKRFIRQVVVGAGSFAIRMAFIRYVPHYDHLPLQLRSVIDGGLIGVMVLSTSLLGMLVPPHHVRRPHAAVAYPAMFLMLPFSSLIPLYENVGDQRVLDLKMGQEDKTGLARMYLDIFWSLGTSVGGLVIGLVASSGTAFRTY